MKTYVSLYETGAIVFMYGCGDQLSLLYMLIKLLHCVIGLWRVRSSIPRSKTRYGPRNNLPDQLSPDAADTMQAIIPNVVRPLQLIVPRKLNVSLNKPQLLVRKYPKLQMSLR